MKVLLQFLFISVLLFSCEPPVTFEEPQPAGASGLKQFPAKLQGNYRSISDNSTLKITSKYLIRIYNEKLLLHKSKLDSGFTINGNILTETKTGEKYKARISGNTIIAFLHATDTVFSLSPDYILTKQKGQFFLNTKYDSNKWGVQKMAVHKNLLSINSVVLNSDLTKLRTVSAAEINYAQKFKPTRKQFKAFVKLDGFGDEEQFIKIQ